MGIQAFDLAAPVGSPTDSNRAPDLALNVVSPAAFIGRPRFC
jgi:hypothetical protein